MSAGSTVTTNLVERVGALEASVAQVIRGKPEAVRLAVACLLARGHLLIEDVPGVGKTTLAHTLARSLDSGFQRIQFTSDMLPADVVGVTVFNSIRQDFEFKPGPIFTNFLLADEINRTTPKTQSALLEAMNERQVTIERNSYPLPDPFMVIATQNPAEYHGTYPLPESQLDRFLLRVEMGYPDGASEREILRSQSHGSANGVEVTPVASGADILDIQRQVEDVRVDETVLDYLMAIVEQTRAHEHLALGVSPRGSMALYRAAQAMALTEGLSYVTPDHIKRLAQPVFAHRLMPSVRQGPGSHPAERCSQILDEILHSIPVPI
jgi:MoxR-like ATPase